ncbi:hypothetical protein COU77_04330 [Candidatus Peregrinibacteria bacterium CG10_big_fil_rev_8_21_14_0_10_49_16]|nr:MAG: hypothetical protein COW95_00145 [Candidatus Peregrinibacteria bacterium CG22_combo_CG10-13_8_21_14_all_49_11]PIR51679.1 MAG: hypothetical protein COU77_04330 [Candidatus Peregrinibacteria bacterium CG10_big_fil_rev_8_21_14_0_10_49_16]
MIALRSKQQRQSPLHFRRIELKYILPTRYVHQFIERVWPYVQVDPYLLSEGKGHTRYPVLSLYFDSADYHSLREKDAGVLSRRKLRLRTYASEFSEDVSSFLEIKRRHDFVVSKDRLSLSVGHLSQKHPMPHLLGHILKRVEAKEEVTAEAELLRGWYNLQPTALVRYERMPFVGKHDRKFRITLDCELQGVWYPPHLFGAQAFRSCVSRYCVLELKCNHAIPAWFHEVIQEMQLVRTAYSKYAMVVSALQPFLFGTEQPFDRRYMGFC